jgi:hypothetical protein
MGGTKQKMIRGFKACILQIRRRKTNLKSTYPKDDSTILNLEYWNHHSRKNVQIGGTKNTISPKNNLDCIQKLYTHLLHVF